MRFGLLIGIVFGIFPHQNETIYNNMHALRQIYSSVFSTSDSLIRSNTIS